MMTLPPPGARNAGWRAGHRAALPAPTGAPPV